ncbi:MAG: sulfatase-like hydrolase/transferase [Candidatus Poribacteria bacterium]|nr:sulfatase-like hydrolase/transferase [Candidatus Poribacteria bacterium]MYK19470.1 sulfatase-like hydrolase/transferase [Candidatus Poribacteria bacterium]
MKSPNILLLMTDQQRWDAMGCSGDWLETPNLDRIASEGVRFTNCVTTSPVCIPTRLSLATGLYPHNTGVWNNMNHQMPAETPTWMQAVRDAGYRTSLFGKTHLHPHNGDLREREGLMNAYGLDDVNEIGGPRASANVLSHMTVEWETKGLWDAYRADYRERFSTKPYLVRPSTLGLENYADVYVGQQAKRYLQNYKREEPWCCWVSFGGPHEPWDTPEPYANMYAPEEMPPAIPRQPAGDRPKGDLDRLMGRVNPTFEPGEIGRLRANYAGNVALIDAQIGEILDAIAARGELENTVIVHTSDHGEMNGDHGLIYKSNFLNGAVRIPLLVRTPKASGLQTPPTRAISESPVEWIDIGPTLVELAGGELEHRQFGKSLCPVLADTEATHRDFAISEIQGEIMLLNREWKAALNADGEVYLLFNVQNDPDETDNLAGKPEVADIETALRLQILERLVQTQQGAI